MANFNFNKIILGGRLTEDPQLQTTPGGISVVSFRIAVNRRGKDKDGETVADFITVAAWRKLAEFITTYFRKSSTICVVGSLQTRSWTDQNGNRRYTTEVLADEAFFVDSKTELPFSLQKTGDVIADPDSPMLSGIDPDASQNKPLPQAFSTPGARAEIRESMQDGDSELPF